MDFIKNWIATVAVTSIVLGIIILLSPSEKTARILKLCASIYMAFTVFAPFINGGFNEILPKLENILSEYDFSTQDNAPENQKSFAAAKYALEEEIKQALLKEEIEVDFIETVIIYQDGKYNLAELKLECNNEKKARTLLTETLCISEKIILFR